MENNEATDFRKSFPDVTTSSSLFSELILRTWNTSGWSWAAHPSLSHVEVAQGQVAGLSRRRAQVGAEALAR